jgi:hypothetical protein
MKIKQLLYILELGFLPGVVVCQNILDAPRLQQPIKFDGIVSEDAWHKIPAIGLTMQTPEFGREPTEKNEIRLAYDETYLYLSGKLFLSDSSFYRPTTYKRDAFDGTTDYFGFIIDSFNDKENALAFFTSPTGLRWDGTLSNDALKEEDIGIDWNTHWDALTHKTSYGYDAEIRIPWTSLRFQDNNNEVVMGVIIWWFLGAKYELDMAPLVPLTWGGMSSWKPSQAQEYRFKNIHKLKPLYFTPYILGGYQQSWELNSMQSAYKKHNEPKIDLGFDLKYSLTNNLTLDLSANTDFAQVEVDDQQVNLTRFSLFFPEKRQFFLERASIFDFRFEDFNRLFYSRQIGIYDEEPVHIYGGARIQGRLGRNDVGFMNMQTESPASSLKPENFSLLRIRRQVLNSYSNIGLMWSNRMDFHGKFNSVYGADAIMRLFGDEYLTVKFAQSFSNDLENKPVSLDPTRIFLHWERRIYDGFAYNLSLSHAGKDWIPEMGFEEREDFTSARAELFYGNIPKGSTALLRWRSFIKANHIQNNENDQTESSYIEPGAEMESKSGWNITASLRILYENVPEVFDLGDVDIQSGKYQFSNVNFRVVSPFTGLTGFMSTIVAGGYYDGNLLSISFSPRYKVSSHLQLEGSYQFSRATFNSRDELFTGHLGRVKAEYMANTKFSIAAFVQYSTFEKEFIPNIRLRYNSKEGNDLYIVINGVFNSGRQRELPHLPPVTNRAIVLKYTYTFIW